jgi:hypothetical protein
VSGGEKPDESVAAKAFSTAFFRHGFYELPRGGCGNSVKKTGTT